MQDNNKILQVNTEAALIGLICAKTKSSDDKMVLSGLCLTGVRDSRKYLDTDCVKIEFDMCKDAVSIKFGSRWGLKLPRGFAINRCEIIVDKTKIGNLDIQNKILTRYKDSVPGRILYSVWDIRKGKNRNKKVYLDDGIAMYFRQGSGNGLIVTVRGENFFDTEKGQKLISKAYKRSLLYSKDFILMYEKECERYEESASVLYEKLIDLGYTNAYYVVNFDNPRIQNLDEKYKRNLVEKESFDHVVKFFACESIISSETVDHALQLRVANKRVRDRLEDPNLKYVFLQHGVMYMVSLNSELRSGFRNSPHKIHRVVVSSEAEAEHFITLGGMKRENLYITGLAKFDRSVRNPNADRIVIMPTWRRWEHNMARKNLKETGYYKLVKTMYDSVPDNLKDKTVILPHPLMAEMFDDDNAMSDRILLNVSYEEVLRTCDVLITDYSSIAYDAFYRGAKVVFCWQDKDECMQHYGEGSFLMLNEDNCYGDVCMNEGEIRKSIQKCYMKHQDDEYIQKFRHIVESHDGKNSDRIVERLKIDGIIHD